MYLLWVQTRITVNHAVEIPYITAVLKEWKMYVDKMDLIPLIKEIHLGGGTPTFFSTENLDLLMSGIFSLAEKAENIECSFEAHPQNTSVEHLELLYEWGFRRISFGIQDFNPEVQKIINRKQSFEQVRAITIAAREVGFTVLTVKSTTDTSGVGMRKDIPVSLPATSGIRFTSSFANAVPVIKSVLSVLAALARNAFTVIILTPGLVVCF